jgi:two-component system OmpR family response regulator
MALILIVDSDPILNSVLQQEYQRQGHQVLVARTAHDALDLSERYPPDLVVLNTVLPQSSGAEVYQRLKAMPGLSKTQVLFYGIQLQVQEEPGSSSQYAGFHAHASPLSELTMRSASLLHRVPAERTPTLADHLIAGTLILHCHNLTFERDGRLCSLTPTEFDLLRYLMLHANETCSAARLLQHVWGYPPGIGSGDLVRTHMRNLRHKIEDCPERPALLRTVRHRGYMLCSNGENGEDQWIAEQNATGPRSSALAHRQQGAKVPMADLAGVRSYT